MSERRNSGRDRKSSSDRKPAGKKNIRSGASRDDKGKSSFGSRKTGSGPSKSRPVGGERGERSERSKSGYDPKKSGSSPAKRYSKPKLKQAENVLSTKSGDTIRLNKFIANAGKSSRREADEYIKAGMVTVNGEVITEMGYQVNPGDTVKYAGEIIKGEKMVYLLLNKPKGFITTMYDPKARKTVMDLVGNACKERIYPVGRLDRATTGVLLFTNDGQLAQKLTHPSHGARKIYLVTLDKPLTNGDFSKIAAGIDLEDGKVVVDQVRFTDDSNKKNIGLEIHIGRNRVVRRLFESLGYEVVKLDRALFAGLTKKNLKRGQWRFLKQEEINFLKMN